MPAGGPRGPAGRAQRGALLAALTATAFAVRFAVVGGRPDPVGTDGYYYVVQAEHIARTGAPHVPDASWVLRWLALPHLLGADPVRGQAIAAALLAAALVPAGFALGTRTQGPLAGWTLAAFAAVSPTVGHLCADFPKSLGAVPALWAMAAVAAAGPGRARLGAALLLALLAAGAHRLGAATVALMAVGLVASLVGRQLSRRTVAGLALAGAVTASAFALAAAWLPGLLHPDDLARATSQLRAVPWPPPPWSWLPLRPATGLAQRLELGLLPWAALLAGIVAVARRPSLRAAALPWLVPLAVVLFPGWRADDLDLAYRLSLFAPILAAPLLLVCVEMPKVRWAPAALLGALLGALPWAGTGFDPGSTPPYAVHRQWIAKIPRPLPALLIVEPGASFLYDHLTGAEAMSWAPEPGLDRTRIWRVASGIRDGEWIAYAPIVDGIAPLRLDRQRVLVREDAWEALVARALAEDDDDLHARIASPSNPSAVRPAALLRNRPPPSLTAPASPAPADR